MTNAPALARPEIQAELISEALQAATVGFLVWDENRRYVAANACACAEALEESVRRGFATGRARVRRLAGSRALDVFYATFTTRTAGMPFMATVIAPLD
jgi:hypothetical protein